MSSGRIAQHRNYGEIMARHEREMRMKRIVKVFIYFLIISFVILIFLLVKRLEQKPNNPVNKPVTTAHHVHVSHHPLN